MFILSGPLISIIGILMFVMFPYLAIRDISRKIKGHISQEESHGSEQRRKEEPDKKEADEVEMPH